MFFCFCCCFFNTWQVIEKKGKKITYLKTDILVIINNILLILFCSRLNEFYFRLLKIILLNGMFIILKI